MDWIPVDMELYIISRVEGFPTITHSLMRVRLIRRDLPPLQLVDRRDPFRFPVSRCCRRMNPDGFRVYPADLQASWTWAYVRALRCDDFLEAVRKRLQAAE